MGVGSERLICYSVIGAMHSALNRLFTNTFQPANLFLEKSDTNESGVIIVTTNVAELKTLVQEAVVVALRNGAGNVTEELLDVERGGEDNQPFGNLALLKFQTTALLRGPRKIGKI